MYYIHCLLSAPLISGAVIIKTCISGTELVFTSNEWEMQSPTKQICKVK